MEDNNVMNEEEIIRKEDAVKPAESQSAEALSEAPAAEPAIEKPGAEAESGAEAQAGAAEAEPAAEKISEQAVDVESAAEAAHEKPAKKQKKKKRGIIRKILAVLAALLLIFLVICYLFRASLAPYVMGSALGSLEIATIEIVQSQIDDFIAAELNDSEEEADEQEYNYNPLEGSIYPAVYDLRDIDGKSYVTSVKSQGQFGTCWTFATVAAGETTLMTQRNTPVTVDADGTKHDPIDLSERHLGWFTYMPCELDDQKGEGLLAFADTEKGYSTDPVDVLNCGGLFVKAEAMLKSGVGFCTEELAPYRPEEVKDLDIAHLNKICEGKDLNDEAVLKELRKDKTFAAAEPYIKVASDGHLGNWNDQGDWSLPEDLHYGWVVPIKATRALPSPQYGNPEGVNAMKRELMEGRAVVIAYHADVSLPAQLDDEPGKEREENYINYDNEDGTWAQYTYKTEMPNHAVCVIGWDDTYPASNFDKDPDRCPPGDGAWIVKNSWGSIEKDFPNYGRRAGWGSDRAGFFYLSYYDRSLEEAETMEFDLESPQEQGDYIIAEEYDFMVSSGVPLSLPSILRGASANIFKAEGDERLTHVGVNCANANSQLKVRIYDLNENYKNPEDGKLLEEVTCTVEDPGFRRIPLETPLEFKQGEPFSIILEEITENGSGKVLTIQMSMGRDATKKFRDYYNEKGGSQEGFMTTYSVGVVNPGESYFRLGDVWMDLADVRKIAAELAYGNNGLKNGGFEIDNFSIKAYGNHL